MKITEKSKNPVYGVIGAIALVLVGGICGYILNGSDHVNRSTMSKYECNQIASQIIMAANNNKPDLIAQLNKVYSENCLNREFDEPKPVPKPEEKKLPETTCEKIELELSNRLNNCHYGNRCDESDHIDEAKMYAVLSERGCPENSAKYRNLAAQELEIARALKDDNLEDRQESIEIVETYKRLQMQKEAEKMIEKAKKLTNPAIDFIIQLEKIIEE